MYFFKFQKPGNLEFNMLRRGEIFFASVAELNDANEFRPRFVLNGTRELWTRLADYILREACIRSDVYGRTSDEEFRELMSLSESLGKRLKQRARNRDVGIEELDALFRELLEQELNSSTISLPSRLILDATRRILRYYLPKAIEEPRYIASFSKNAKNPTMWGHYADAERGFVIVFSTDTGTLRIASPINILHGTRPLPDGVFEIGTYTEENLELKAVKYGRKPPKVNAFHRLIPNFSYSEKEDHYDVPLLLGGDAKEKKEEQIGLIKYTDWGYEQEIRAFLPVFNELPPDMRVMRADVESVCGLIFGPRMSEQDKMRAVLCCHLMRESIESDRDSLPQFMFFQAHQVVDRFDLRIVPVGVLDGQYYAQDLPIKKIDALDETAAKTLREASDQIGNRVQDTPVDTKSPTSK